MKAIVNGRIVLEDRILDGGTLLFDQKIVAAGFPDQVTVPEDAEIVDAKGQYVGPGFIDLHCHAANQYNSWEHPAEYAAYHLKYGTTGVLATLGYDLSYEVLLEGVRKVKEAIQNGAASIAGIHLEGPYTNPDFGFPAERYLTPDPEKLVPIFEEGKGLIKLMTLAPELEGNEAVAKLAQQYGITLSVGHSRASEEQIYHFRKYGLKVACHHMNACGASYKMNLGIRTVGVSEAVMASDDITAEIIPDYEGIHVRPLNIRYTIKCKGVDHVAIITDSCSHGEPYYAQEKNLPNDCDINMVNNTLCGSWMNMSKACYNMKRHSGESMVNVFKMASATPAKAVGLFSTIGSLEEGKDADIVLCDEDFNLSAVYSKGEKAR